MHSSIATLQEFIETFLYYFEQGSNAEYVSLDKDLFFFIYDKLYDSDHPVPVNEEIGGHSPVWSKRAQVENCRVYTTPWPSDFNKEKIPLKDHYNGSNLIMPFELMEEPEHVNRKSKQDLHLVFEYRKGDEILGIVAPRSNRFYFVHDPNGASFVQLETYHDLLDKVDPEKRPYRHMFGGFQLMQRLTAEETESRLEKMASLWFEAKQDGPGPDGQKNVFHVELAHFSSFDHFKLFEKYAVRNADSLGMNEVEMQMLLDYWKDGDDYDFLTEKEA